MCDFGGVHRRDALCHYHRRDALCYYHRRDALCHYHRLEALCYYAIFGGHHVPFFRQARTRSSTVAFGPAAA